MFAKLTRNILHIETARFAFCVWQLSDLISQRPVPVQN